MKSSKLEKYIARKKYISDAQDNVSCVPPVYQAWVPVG